MGLLIDGVWHDQWYDTASTEGRFIRQNSQFRDWVTPEEGEFSDRYHLYVSYACPWAHRTLIFRQLKGLEKVISVSVVNWYMGEEGWSFAPGAGVTGDNLYGFEYLHQIYTKADPQYTGRVTVPILWDKHKETIVNNESSEIIRMFNSAFTQVGEDYYPEDLREEIDQLNDRIYNSVNNGVYKAGFATTQTAYSEAIKPLFDTLDYLEDRLATRRYLTGDRLTEADWRLFTTLVRFDAVYVGHFKCNLRLIVDYPNLWAYLRHLYHIPGISGTVNFQHIKGHYYESHKTINPTGIVPLGPEIDWTI
ncbi:glutathione S-transferase family protein [Gloeocapsa sp. PCC 73106]|uniref:glutathione S-transferase family protein n=1 Tax=Gloeocapsa sp. PCC 73106 TaxID=102232 RepID=UPI0002ABF658|nr:glutathione S-transferase family protein [Gloeocapsa sp. PCC 73106]ELR97410.1 putative glutathione S-transferase [Gloeocapsa sp. PCC 73106]